MLPLLTIVLYNIFIIGGSWVVVVVVVVEVVVGGGGRLWVVAVGAAAFQFKV